MDVRLLWTVTLLLRLSAAQRGGSVCIQASARSCGECLQVSESCGWCSDESFLRPGEATSARCDDLQSLSERRCPPGKIQNLRGSIQIEKNQPLSDRKKDSPEKLTPEQITQIQPQKLSLTLRSGEPQTFSLKFKRAEDYPIDLYYLMDLSSSMKDDLENVKNLGTDLVREMQGITSDFRIGFGSMVKTPPPCPGTQSCPFSFTNVLSLTDRGDEFSRRVSEQQIPHELQSAQGAAHSVLQVALCQEQIGWREATRLLVVSSDAEFLAQGDGRRRLQEQCQMINHTYNYNGQAARSVSQLRSALSQHNIQTIFAVTENVLPGYKELVDHIPKSTVGTLSSNSSNILELIVDAYNSLSSEVILKNSRLPEGVSISYKSLCKDGVEGTGESGRKCSNISIGDEVSFQISVTAQKCPEPVRAEVIKIKPLGFNEEVEVVLNFICECECSAQRELNSNKCSSGHGALECGACKCNEGWIGRLCECSIDEVRTEDLDATCRSDGGTDICSNNGDCVCGACDCKKRENPEERYSGRYCECDNFNCDRSGNKLCGGHGRCECGVCICDANYTGSACDCALDVTSCLASNGQICNGRGMCECGVCRCTSPKFQGPTCEFCPTCPGVCTEHKDCVLCRAYGAGPKAATCERDCSYFTLTKVKETKDLPEPADRGFPLAHCRERDESDCWFYFTYGARDGTKEVHAVQKPDCPSTQFSWF